jgi:hypothetical protein
MHGRGFPAPKAHVVRRCRHEGTGGDAAEPFHRREPEGIVERLRGLWQEALDQAGRSMCGPSPAGVTPRPSRRPPRRTPGGAGRTAGPGAAGSRDGTRRDHQDPAGDRARPAAGHPVRHGRGDPVRLAKAGSGQLVPGRCRPVPASGRHSHSLAKLAALEAARGCSTPRTRPSPAGAARSSASGSLSRP